MSQPNEWTECICTEYIALNIIRLQQSHHYRTNTTI